MVVPVLVAVVVLIQCDLVWVHAPCVSHRCQLISVACTDVITRQSASKIVQKVIILVFVAVNVFSGDS
jgi:hypothetical protein